MESPSGTDPDAAAPVDNFYSPANDQFYSHQPYESLEKSQHSIRLLRIVEKTASGDFHCTLTSGISLAKAEGTYTAISYCAGDPKDTRSIEVNGIQFNAFANAIVALDEICHYRASEYGDEAPSLWLDQICINQSDPTERSHQVGFMRDIYRSASEVIICLSTDTTERRAVDWLKHVHANIPGLQELSQTTSVHDDLLTRIDTISYARKGQLAAALGRYPAIQELVRFLWSNLVKGEFLAGWKDALDMLHQPWWTRAWVFQEYFVSRQPCFIYGRQSLPACIFSAVLMFFVGTLDLTLDIKFFLEMNTEHTADSEECLHIASLRQWLPLLRTAKPAAVSMLTIKHVSSPFVDLTELLCHSRICKASDLRDHVYAFIGIAIPDYEDIIPDYDAVNTASNVFITTAKSIIAHDANLDIIAHATERKCHRDTALPSWVPDWTLRQLYRSAPEWAAGLNGLFDATFTDGGMTLETSALFVDTLCVYTGSEASRMKADTFEKFDLKTVRPVAHTFVLNAMPNDQLWILCGAKVPFTLRCSGTRYRLICASPVFDADGKSYTNIMRGDLLNSAEGKAARRRIQIW
jgi:hypothetical protein